MVQFKNEKHLTFSCTYAYYYFQQNITYALHDFIFNIILIMSYAFLTNVN